MNLLERQVLRLISEDIDSPDVFTDDALGLALIRGSINDALQEMCLSTGSYSRTYYLPLFAGRQWYRMAPKFDFIAFVNTVWDREHHYRLLRNEVAVLNDQDPFWLRRQGRPLQYVTASFDYMGLYPVPSEEGKILEITCACVPAPYITDKDPIKIREQYQRAAVQLAVSEFFASRGDAKRATEYYEHYMETAQIMIATPDYSDRQLAMASGSSKMGEWNSRSGQ